jgi:hypothetical protein
MFSMICYMEYTVAQSVEALHYKPAGQGKILLIGSLRFLIDLILLIALWPWG